MTVLSLPVLLRSLCVAEGWEVLPREDGARWLKSVAFETGLPFEQVMKCAISLGLWPYTPAEMVRRIERPSGRAAYDALSDALTAGLAASGVPGDGGGCDDR